MQRRTLLAAAAALPTWTQRAHAAPEPSPGKEIVIGQSAVLSGPLGPAMRGYVAGAEIAFAAANATGGVHGRKIKYVYLDDELKPDRTVARSPI